MATGTHFGGQCFAEAFAATDAYLSAHHPTKLSFEGSCAYKIAARSEDLGAGEGVQVTFTKTLLDGSETEACPAVSWTEYTPLGPCEIVTSADVMEASWMVAAVWLAVYAMKLMRRALP